MSATECVMVRSIHEINCLMGISSHREELRARFSGVPCVVVNYFFCVEKVRSMLAQLGYKKLDDITGGTGLLRHQDTSLVQTQHLDTSHIPSNVVFPKRSSSFFRKQEVQSKEVPVLDFILLLYIEVSNAIANEEGMNKTVEIYNIYRAIGDVGVVKKKYIDTSTKLNIAIEGNVGQSSILTPGIHRRLEGEANAYMGKGIVGCDGYESESLAGKNNDLGAKTRIQYWIEKNGDDGLLWCLLYHHEQNC